MRPRSTSRREKLGLGGDETSPIDSFVSFCSSSRSFRSRVCCSSRRFSSSSFLRISSSSSSSSSPPSAPDEGDEGEGLEEVGDRGRRGAYVLFGPCRVMTEEDVTFCGELMERCTLPKELSRVRIASGRPDVDAERGPFPVRKESLLGKAT